MEVSDEISHEIKERREMNRRGQEETEMELIIKRLDALIRLFIEINKPKGKERFNEATAARMLRSIGLKPKEIARILGKKSVTDIAPYLYSRRSKRKIG